MKHAITPILTVALAAFCACQSSDIYSSLPAPIESFISKYWPNPDISDFEIEKDGSYSVTVKNGVTVEFDSDYSWTEVDGDGMPLPEMFLSDCLPSTLYNYLETAEATNQVFEVERNAARYEVTLLSSKVYYTIATDRVSGQLQR